nr:retrovirus-related Pol polyprotein from transposon TNT 1-94 [Tanacetum cinerariifolium]
MESLADKAILSGAENRPPMLEKDMYDSWRSRMEMYMLNRQHGKIILESVEHAKAIQADCDVKATNIILQVLPLEIYALVSKAVITEAVSLNPIDPKLLKVDVTPVFPKLRLNMASSASESMYQDNTKNNRIRRTQKRAKKNKVEDHPKTVKSSLNKASVVDSKATSSVLNSVSNVNSNLNCASSNGCFFSDNNDTCVNARNVFPLTRIATPTIVPPREPIPIVNKTDKPVVTLVVQIVLWYLDSGCSKHMAGDRSQLINFVQKFLGTVKFGNNHVAKIMGYGDYQIGNVTISRV